MTVIIIFCYPYIHYINWNNYMKYIVNKELCWHNRVHTLSIYSWPSLKSTIQRNLQERASSSSTCRNLHCTSRTYQQHVKSSLGPRIPVDFRSQIPYIWYSRTSIHLFSWIYPVLLSNISSWYHMLIYNIIYSSS